jgi:hypothetical protein
MSLGQSSPPQVVLQNSGPAQSVLLQSEKVVVDDAVSVVDTVV